MAQPADSIPYSGYDLEEIVITGRQDALPIEAQEEGKLVLSTASPSSGPSFMGGGDVMSVLKSLPSVATTNDLRGALNVRGGATGSNLFESDGARVINPLHMLGLYSGFNPSFYKKYDFFAGYKSALSENATGALILAESGLSAESELSGDFSIGLIESHGAMTIPLRKGTSALKIGARGSYLNLLFPKVLTLGESVLDYNFVDFNLSYVNRFRDADILRVSIFGNGDGMRINNKAGGSHDGDFGWGNVAASVAYTRGRSISILTFSGIRNRFNLKEGGFDIVLPSSMYQLAAKQSLGVGAFQLEGDLAFRRSSGQRNVAVGHDGESGASESVELNLGGEWRHLFFDKLEFTAGLRLSLYHGGSFNAARLQPRLYLGLPLLPEMKLEASYGRYVKFDRQIEESSVGLPVDFWVCAGPRIKPEDVHAVELGFSGYIPFLRTSYTVQGYYKYMGNVAEFGGSLLDFVSGGYDPLDNIYVGRGYAAGLSLSVMRQFGKVKGRISYNYGVARARIPEYGEGWIPTVYDRPHDLNVNLSYSIIPTLMVSATMTFASGVPYTMAKFGYMIGENLICEYYPHNSSRLPAYKRLDFMVDWKLPWSRSLRQHLQVSVYNLLGSNNVLLSYISYTLDKGIEKKQAVMKAVIPSLTYSIEF